MKNMTLSQIASACHGTYYGPGDALNKEVTSVVIDSRLAQEGCLFIPIKGARVDGHTFIPQVIAQGALCTLSEKVLPDATHPYIVVDSSEQALKDLAEYYRAQLDVKVIGITGSVGKTSTKEMIASVLSQKYNVLKTAGNFNNEIGLPLTIFQIQETHDVAVLEMGISHFEEMHRLAKIARPDIAVITNIGCCHLENLGDRDGVRKAKTELFDYLQPEAQVVLNGDDDKLTDITEVQGQSTHFFSDHFDGLHFTDTSHIPRSFVPETYATDITDMGLDGTSCRIHLADHSFPVHISIPGSHMVHNALAGSLVGHLLSLNEREIKAGIEALIPVSGRNHMIHTAALSIIDDCYNANPVSMKASLDVLSSAKGQKVAILGDMFELGVDEKKLHREIGTYAVEKGIDVICCIGSLSREMHEGAMAANLQASLLNSSHKNCSVHYYQTKADFLKDMKLVIAEGDTVLVKASHGMEFPEIVDTLQTLQFS